MDSYNDILDRMKTRYRELTSEEVPELSDIDIRMRALAGEIYNDEVNLEFIKRQMFPSTASGEYLDRHAADRGIERKEAVKASGSVRFFVNEAALEAIVIPEGTVVATTGDNPVRFLTDSQAVLEAGSSFVSVGCTAQTGGVSGNAAANTVNTIVTNVVGIDGVNNLWAFTGGSDEESDSSLRKRVVDSYKSVSNGTNTAYYKRLALSVDGVASANVVPRARGEGTVDVYIACPNNAQPTRIISEVQSVMNTQREINVNVEVSSANVYSVTLGVFIEIEDGYAFDVVRNNVINSVTEFINSLEVGESLYEYPLSAAIYNVDGVKNFSYNNLYPASCSVDVDDYLTLDEIFVNESGDEE
mgnify:CR=1 FL=1